MGEEKAVVLLSGGIDSTVSLYWAKKQGWDVRPLTFHYFRRPPQEVVATRGHRLPPASHAQAAELGFEIVRQPGLEEFRPG